MSTLLCTILSYYFAVHSVQVALYGTRLCYVVVRNLGLHSVAHLHGSADARL